MSKLKKWGAQGEDAERKEILSDYNVLSKTDSPYINSHHFRQIFKSIFNSITSGGFILIQLIKSINSKSNT